MAENKKSVLMYCDIIHTVEELTDTDAGKLFKHYLRYINDQNPEPPSKLIKIVFEPIKQNLKRDLKKWERKSEKNSENAKKRWSERMPNNANASERIKPDANYADKDTVTVTDNVTDTDKGKSNPLFFPLEKLEKILLCESTWHTTIGMEAKIKTPIVENWIRKFILKLTNEGETGKTIRDAKAHFRNWLLLELQKPENKTQFTIDQKVPATQPKKLNL